LFKSDMTRREYLSHKIIFKAIICMALLLVFLRTPPTAFAGEEGGDRTTTTIVKVTEHSWWLVGWADNEIVCEVVIDHEGLPWRAEIFQDCGVDVFDEWQDSVPCTEAESGDTSTCQGLYLHYVGSERVEREIVEELPALSVGIDLRGCTYDSLSYICDRSSYFEIMAEEPLPGEYITVTRAEFGGESYACSGDRCSIQLPSTELDGAEIEFWAVSSLGDESEHFTALIRKVFVDADLGIAGEYWQVDVLSSRWRGEPLLECALTWDAFPPVGRIPNWLTTPEDQSELATDLPLDLLAARLIQWGFVEAEECPFRGFLASGFASNCGIEQTREYVDEWQDRFDARILRTAKQVDVPAILLKNLFAQESQFWPGSYPAIKEYGLGQLHQLGGEALLLWNSSFYEDFCPLVLSEESCSYRYDELNETNQELLRGALTIAANVNCPSCPGGIDLDKAELSVNLFGSILRAGCDQVSQTVRYISDDRPGAVSSYEDLWRFVLVNYNAGPGCLATALDATWDDDEPLDWEHVSEQLLQLEACDGAVEYVERVARQ
jgi:hypothetical protein